MTSSARDESSSSLRRPARSQSRIRARGDRAKGSGTALLRIFSKSKSKGVVRGVLETDWFWDLEGACVDPIDGIRIEVGPRSNTSCFAASPYPTCNDPSIKTCVCHDDPYCCQYAWDAICVGEAGACPL